MNRLLDLLIAAAIEHPAALKRIQMRFATRPTTREVLPAMLQAMGSSIHTLQSLSNEPGLQSRDCFSICRSVVEMAVNICYILAEGEDAATQARRHAGQKSVQDLRRESTVGSQRIQLRWSGLDSLQLSDGLKDAFGEFTSRSGREQGWTDLRSMTVVPQWATFLERRC